MTENPRDAHNQISKITVDSFVGRQLIKQEVGQSLKISNPRTARCYILPDRPVVSYINCHSANIYKYSDIHLNPVVQRLSSFVGDTTDFINKLSKVETTNKRTFSIDGRYISLDQYPKKWRPRRSKRNP